ncbi:TetR/AcrR family transcriptional regulator [Burkholderia gladioli]|uniref:TetR/AcrR family transcriptional regulator n=2 Tax=Burkholderiaceae TaxID=119060 RepID=UPI00163E7AF1|nr:TetR/AcrR family transcriptional regulator [Burkholderia gladioli]NBI44506.1 TetR/AcrR family transcriptional regulator [Burkholderia sp. ISTR5]
MPQQPKPLASKRGRPVSFDREEVLERAMRVFWKNGFAGTSMSELIAAMGIASPSLYAAFGSKAALYREALDHYLTLHQEDTARIMELPTARESIEGLLRHAVTVFSRTGFPSGCMVEQTAGEAGDMPPDIVKSLREMRASNKQNFQSRLRRGIEDGDVAAGTDIRAVGAFYATVLKGLSLSAKGGTGTSELNSVITSAMAAWPLLVGA